jgi:hypothetical protein
MTQPVTRANSRPMRRVRDPVNPPEAPAPNEEEWKSISELLRGTYSHQKLLDFAEASSTSPLFPEPPAKLGKDCKKASDKYLFGTTKSRGMALYYTDWFHIATNNRDWPTLLSKWWEFMRAARPYY